MYRTESCGRRARRARTRRGGPAAPAAVLCHACLGSVGQGGHSAQRALVLMTSQRPAASTFNIDWTWEHWGKKVPVDMYQPKYVLYLVVALQKSWEHGMNTRAVLCSITSVPALQTNSTRPVAALGRGEWHNSQDLSSIKVPPNSCSSSIPGSASSASCNLISRPTIPCRILVQLATYFST